MARSRPPLPLYGEEHRLTLPTHTPKPTDEAAAAEQQSSVMKATIAVIGIFWSFSYFAILQEDVYKKEYGGQRFTYTFFILLFERATNSLVAFVGMKMMGSSPFKAPVREISISGTTQMFAMGASNEALRYVSYPTQVLGKSCKMVPVFVAGILLANKAAEYALGDYLQVLIVTLGVCVFNFGGPAKEAGGDSAYGLILILLSLCMDGATGGLQDRVKLKTKEINHDDDAKITMFESMFYTNASGAAVAFALCLATGQGSGGLAFILRSPELLMAIALFAVMSAFGQCFVFFTINEFGPLWLTTLTTTRKIFSTVYSVFRSPDNRLSGLQWVGCGLVFAGIIMETVRKNMKSKPKTKALVA